MHPEAGSQGANTLWFGQPHHPKGTAAPSHTRKASQWRQVSPPHLGGEREDSAQSPVSLIGNEDVSGAWPIGIWPQHLFQPVRPKSGHLPLHLSQSEQVYQSGGTSNRSLLHRGLLGRSLLWRSGSHPNTRPTWAYHWAFGPPV